MRRNVRASLVLVTVLTILLALVLPLGLTSTALAAGGSIDTSTANEGYIRVTHPGEWYGRVKVIIQKDSQRYTYDVRSGDNPESLPLQMGNGIYTIRLMRNTTGNSYQEIGRTEIAVEIQDEKSVYLSSVQNIDWKASDKVAALAKELVEGIDSDAERIKTIYGYIIKNFTYDYNKARQVGPGYLPDLDEVLEAKKGICYDFASLMAGMLRSVGVPTKLITGYVGPQRGYHAWNAAFDGEDWEQLDPTLGAARSRKSIVKPDETYEIRYEY